MSIQVGSRLNCVKATISQIEAKYKRVPGSVRLLAVSKKKSTEEIIAAIAGGQVDFGESYVKEAIEKISVLKSYNLCWHFIGPIQKNKTKLISENFNWVHSIDREIIAQRLNEQRPDYLPPLEVCIQINLNNEASKSGIKIENIQALANFVRQQPRLNLRGLMTIPKASNDTIIQRQQFSQLRELLQYVNESGFEMDTLSMGMSSDLESAIAEGATIVRIGTAIFGERDKS